MTTTPRFTGTFDQPVRGALYVKLDNGTEWPAAQADLAKFGLVLKGDAYRGFHTKLEEILRDGGILADGQSLHDAAINPLRYLAELAITYPDGLDHEEFAETADQVVAIEQAILRDRARFARAVAADQKCGNPDNCTCTHGCDIP